jgi:hypothetical protein
MTKFVLKYPLWSLFIFSVMAFFLHLSLMPVSIMEARNFLVTREMLVDGNWLLTTLNGIPRYEKPPLPAWISSLFVRGHLDSVVAYRLPTSIMSALGVFTLYFVVHTLTTRKTLSLVSALVLGSSFYYISIQLEAPSDMYTHVFMLLAILFLSKLFLANSRRFLYFVGASICISASVLCKGPVSLYALFLPFMIAYAWVYRLNFTKSMWLLGVLLLGIGIGSSWFVYVRWADATAFLEVATRESNNWTSYNVRPFYYYWSFFVQSGIWSIPALLSLLYPYYKNKVQDKKTYLFSWLWTILTLILLSIIPEKKSRYLMPILIPLAITLAQVIIYQWNQLKEDKVSRIGMYTHYALLLIVSLSICFIPFFITERTNTFWMWYFALAGSGIGMGIFFFFHLKNHNFKELFMGNLMLILLFTSLGNYGFSFAFNPINYAPISEISSVLTQKKVYYFKEIRPEVVWETKTISNELNLENLSPEDTFIVLVNEEFKTEFLTLLPKKLSPFKLKTFESKYITNKRNLRNKDSFIHHVYIISVARNKRY